MTMQQIQQQHAESMTAIRKALDTIAGEISDTAERAEGEPHALSSELAGDVAYLLRSVLSRALGLNCIADPDWPAVVMNDQRRRIHVAFGAPGDFGYDTPLGAALQKLYRIDYTPTDTSALVT